MPVFVKHEWPATNAVGALVADTAQWMLTARRPDIAAASGLGPVDTIFNVLRSLPTSKLLTEDLDKAKRRARQFRGEPTPLANFGARAWPTTQGAASTPETLRKFVQELAWLGWRLVDAITLRAEGKVGFLVALPFCDPLLGLPKVSYTTTEAELDNMLRALVLLVHALFRAAFG